MRAFYEAVIQKNPTAVYALLHPDVSQKLPRAEFGRRLEAYRRKLGFDPEKVAVRTCDEHGTEATVRVFLSGHGQHRHGYEDNLFLRRQEQQWRVILPPRFGLR
ncbi:MAG: hypothetical protein LC104_05470 [Bacteroidales bacterium]|nr:hypothetical protein [Bacteroidales bacterium]